MRTLTVCAVVLVILGVILVPGLWSHMKQLPKDIGNGIDNSVSDDHVVSMAENDFSGQEKTLRERYAKVYKLKVREAEISAEVQGYRSNLTGEEQILAREKDVLKSNPHDAKMVIGGTSYTWDDVNEDALSRLHNCQLLRKKIESNEQSLKQLQTAIQDGLKQIAQQQSKLSEGRVQLDLDKVELEALRSQEEVRQLIGEISKTGDYKTDLGHARKLVQDRINELRSNAEFDQQASGRKPEIPWNKELGIPQKQAADGIEAYFGNKTGAAETVPTSQPK